MLGPPQQKSFNFYKEKMGMRGGGGFRTHDGLLYSDLVTSKVGRSGGHVLSSLPGVEHPV